MRAICTSQSNSRHPARVSSPIVGLVRSGAKKLSVLLESLFAGNDAVDRKALCVVPGLFAWEIHVDVLVLATGGNLMDSISLAFCVAMSETTLPKVDVVEPMEEGESVQLRVDDRQEAGRPIPLKRRPLCVTVAQLQERFLLDVTMEEELCADAMLIVVVDACSGNVVGMHKLGKGLFDIASLPVMLERCQSTASALMRQLEHELARGVSTATVA
eukprot:NODE_12040_length_1249_cov_4.750446.p2 GENE.NODE_12040_length_1249_cov_4.750446~~NODE_12040_length_1249_cov_4.750446.p2  ORF type:complete len:215 (+),score=48.16 NODE_12040_length_1249_cov_4.750446:377-1021(+)